MNSVGSLLYGTSGLVASFDDRALAHLQIVITTKLHRQESLLFSWQDSPQQGSGRNSIWPNPASVLYYRFDGSRPPRINRAWLEVLTASANCGTGLVFTLEPHGPLSGTEE